MGSNFDSELTEETIDLSELFRSLLKQIKLIVVLCILF